MHNSNTSDPLEAQIRHCKRNQSHLGTSVTIPNTRSASGTSFIQSQKLHEAWPNTFFEQIRLCTHQGPQYLHYLVLLVLCLNMWICYRYT